MTETFAIPCAAALIRREVAGQPCVLLQTRHKPGAGIENGLLELPAGKVREYESLFDTLRREVAEETGLTVTHIGGEAETWRDESLGYAVQTSEPYCVTQNLSGGYSILLSTFLCEAEGEARGSTESHSPRWVPLTEVLGLLDTQPEIFYPLHIGALRQYAARICADVGHVFVYGTLKSGQRNAAWASAVAAPISVQPATLCGFTLHHLGRYPGVLPGGGEVSGELLTYPPEALGAALAHLDELEGYGGHNHPDNLFARELRRVTLPDSRTVTAWVYVYARPLHQPSPISGGVWQDDLPLAFPKRSHP